jgi:hypothetical protein
MLQPVVIPSFSWAQTGTVSQSTEDSISYCNEALLLLSSSWDAHRIVLDCCMRRLYVEVVVKKNTMVAIPNGLKFLNVEMLV